MKRIVLTGPSSCGKTSTLNQLKRIGFNVMPEVARPVLSMGINDLVLNQSMIFASQFYAESLQPPDKIIFFDRGVFDSIAFSKKLGIELPEQILTTAKEINYDIIFYLEPLKDFKKDGLRIEKDTEESLEFAEEVKNEYEERGFKVINVPAMSIKNRVSYILDKINLNI